MKQIVLDFSWSNAAGWANEKLDFLLKKKTNCLNQVPGSLIIRLWDTQKKKKLYSRGQEDHGDGVELVGIKLTTTHKT